MRTLAIATLFLIWASSTSAVTLDQRDPNYQKSIEQLTQARDALQVAMDRLRKGEAFHPQPGLNLIPILGRIQEIQKTLDMILMPEKKRYEHQELVPDGTFFTPLPLKEQ